MAVDINGIKTAFKNILDTANTTTAAFDLSTGMSPRVQRVMKINLSRIRPQASFFPLCTIYTDSKDPDIEDISATQLIAKRFADISFNVIGAVWSPMITDIDKDVGTEQIEVLMENIEEVVRRNYKLSNTVLWTKPGPTSYGTLRFGTTDQVTIGHFDLIAKVQY
jgi:hypothetical protein